MLICTWRISDGTIAHADNFSILVLVESIQASGAMLQIAVRIVANMEESTSIESWYFSSCMSIFAGLPVSSTIPEHHQ